MSELTTCNYCTLIDIRRREEKNGGKVVIKPSKGGGIDVFVEKDGKITKKLGIWFMELTDHCVC